MLNDFYPTPAAITEGLVNSVSITGSIFEPCAGHNAITDVLNQHPGIHAVGSDLLWIVPDKHTTNDATDPQFWQEWGKFAWVVTNPPFSEAEKILPLAYEHAVDRGGLPTAVELAGTLQRTGTVDDQSRRSTRENHHS
jgi:hypothetical protein